ncbi:MAG TPA: hypothetical protein VEH84_04790 [Alphaproteobacteria bacterium]|nr:hypothetical protein [Alphaproteobacteria bacterium]
MVLARVLSFLIALLLFGAAIVTAGPTDAASGSAANNATAGQMTGGQG